MSDKRHRAHGRRILKLNATLPLLCIASSAAEPPLEPVLAEVPPAAIDTVPPRRLYVSGHSLTNRPFPDYVAAIADAAGAPLKWNMQHLYGSSLKQRTRGTDAEAWSGYRAGTDAHGRQADVLGEFQPGSNQSPYDALVLAERHTLLESLVWNDTIGHVLDYDARFRASNPSGHTYLFTTWLQLDSLDNPARWIAYERGAALAWECTAAQINLRLAAQGVDRPVRLIPAAEGLAALVAAALEPRGLPGISAETPRKTLATLFADDVHLTSTGNYYVALLAYDALSGGPPQGQWTPGIEPAAAAALRNFANAFMARKRREPAMSARACGERIASGFAPIYLAYMRDTRWRDEGWLRAQWKWARFSVEWPRLLRSNSEKNPFRRPAENH